MLSFNMNIPKQLAIIGATASGKSSLSLELAKKQNGIILSLDSLSVYKEINIASAKPTEEERKGILHFGIDEIYPNEPFDVTIFIKLYEKALNFAKQNDKNLIIVGGSSFYLKTLIYGISNLPNISQQTKEKTAEFLTNKQDAYDFINAIDPTYMSKIKPNDSYRIEKALNIYFETDTKPSAYFEVNPPMPIITEPLPIYEIKIPREELRDRIKRRTLKMIEDGLIDEIKMLETTYSREPNPMKAIGIKETLDFIDRKISKDELIELISTHTAQLAKRQTTFNRTQFKDKTIITNNEIEVFEDFLN
ncbi:MAG: tRNA (adenosine(37)-N6)-dimethylallyltransferase MiaA [Sulfurovaceae bacterium]|nr:tRNA (adenosine(37)-N6)-dimethylallyltransferase MiaA [Sulfurovaceae bacterium]MDD5549184.1 tRNA (adenosine(37)-N6)-dimethylallyltransferase MiaA [Sulfurovaceae bacterium]